MKAKISRRSAIRTVTGTAALAGAAKMSSTLVSAAEGSGAQLKGNIHHSVCRWCYQKVALDDLCKAGKEMGQASVELVTVSDFPTLKKYGLICAMVSGVPGGITDGLNRIENHGKIVRFFERQRLWWPRRASQYHHFSGNRRGASDEQGLENCASDKRIVPIVKAQCYLMELLNNKVNPDYM